MNGSPPGYGLRYGPMSHCPSTSRFPTLGTPIYWSHPSWLSPISSLFLFWNLGQITSTFKVKCRTYPPCLRYPHHAYRSSRITWKCQITSDTPGPQPGQRRYSLYHPPPSILRFHIGTIVVLSDLLCLWSTVIITLTIWPSLTRLYFLLVLCSSGISASITRITR